MGFLSKIFSSRRNDIVEKYIKEIIASGRTEADARDLYFEAACKYGVDNGGKLYDDMRDSIVFDKIIDGQNYSVFFMKLRSGGGTKITVTKQRSSYEIASQEADEYVRNVRESLNPTETPKAPLPAQRPRGGAEPEFPSWFDDDEALEAFSNVAYRAVHKSGVALSFLLKFRDNEEALVLLWSYVAKIESQGGDLKRQQDGVVEVMTSSWNKLDSGQKAKFFARDAELIRE